MHDTLSSHDLSEDIRFSDKVLGDVKSFIAVSLFTVMRFYMSACNQDEILKDYLQEKLMQFIAKKILTANVY